MKEVIVLTRRGGRRLERRIIRIQEPGDKKPVSLSRAVAEAVFKAHQAPAPQPAVMAGMITDLGDPHFAARQAAMNDTPRRPGQASTPLAKGRAGR
jgi:hypothetical protein